MTSKKSVLNLLRKKFRTQTELISELYDESDSFRSLCTDYIECMQVIERLKYTSEMLEEGSLREYQELYKELENEISNRLSG